LIDFQIRMEEPQLLHLNLRTSLEYTEAPLVPFARIFPTDDETVEYIFCFELDQGQAIRIDPDPSAFPGKLVFSGKRSDGQGKLQLPEGLYAFVQKRKELNQEECIAMAIEQQKDGLWERLRLGNRLYIRYLFEDGSPVTQFFRPCVYG